jgi:chorismate mutase / prephenate dehydratase
MEELNVLRNQINEIDDELVSLFLKRMDRVKEVGILKNTNSMEIIDKKRENQIISKHINELEDIGKRENVKSFIENLIHISRKSQFEIFDGTESLSKAPSELTCCRVGFQGVPGSYSHQALVKYFGDETKNQIRSKNYASFKDVFEGVINDEIAYGVLPIENSSTGSITEVYDLLKIHNAYITGEACIEVTHNLLGIEGAQISDIKEVYSHTQGFLQCDQYLETNKAWELIAKSNTAKSAEFVSESACKTKACIASKDAATIYGLKILKENINNYKKNYTRFIIIEKGMKVNHENNKISLVTILPHKVGALQSILKHFVDNHINMTKIESRPIANQTWRYYFYIDIKGNLKDENVNKALKAVENESLYYKLLGNFNSIH